MIDPASLADAEEFCAELIRRLDAGVGPELSGQGGAQPDR
jgi:hypothetical protein